MKNVKIKELTVDEFKKIISESIRETFEDLIEDLVALSSKNYLKSIEEARKDYIEGRVKKLEDVFNVWNTSHT